MFKVGDVVRVTHNGETWLDVVRKTFKQTVLLEPYARNEVVDALVLTERSWALESECEALRDGAGAGAWGGLCAGRN